MGAGRYPAGASDEDARAQAEETTLADDEWPVAEQYRVEPSEPAPPPVDEGTIVIAQDEPPAPASPPRRFPPEVGRGLAAAVVGVLLAALLVPAGFWLATRSEEDAAGAEPTATETTAPETTTQPPTMTAERAVPDVTGRTLAEARELLENAGLEARFRRIASDRPRNEVLSQKPESGDQVERGSVVVLTVSSGVELIAVPYVEGLRARVAKQRLRDEGLEGRTRRVPSDEQPGTVVAQDPPAGEDVSKGSVVVLDIAKARESEPPASDPATVQVPNVVGMTSADARSRLRSAGLRSTQRPVESSSPAGTVVSQSPGAGTELREGGTVTLRVSSGPPSVLVPDVIGLNEAAAVQQLEAAGFDVRVVDQPTQVPTEDGIVIAQVPPTGTTARKGSAVTITVARLG